MKYVRVFKLSGILRFQRSIARRLISPIPRTSKNTILGPWFLSKEERNWWRYSSSPSKGQVSVLEKLVYMLCTSSTTSALVSDLEADQHKYQKKWKEERGLQNKTMDTTWQVPEGETAIYVPLLIVCVCDVIEQWEKWVQYSQGERVGAHLHLSWQSIGIDKSVPLLCWHTEKKTLDQ